MVSLKEKENLLKANVCRVSRLGTISLISKQYKNTCRGVLFFLKLQVLHNTPSEVFLTLLMMMMNCFWGVDDRRNSFSLISSRDHCQRSSPSWISDVPRAGFEPVQNLSSGSSDNHYTTAQQMRLNEANCPKSQEKITWTMHIVYWYPQT